MAAFGVALLLLDVQPDTETPRAALMPEPRAGEQCCAGLRAWGAHRGGLATAAPLSFVKQDNHVLV